jgi:hypothetical protein
MQRLPKQYTTTVFLDVREPDIEMRIDPALIASGAVPPPGTKIDPREHITGIGITMTKAKSLNVVALMPYEEALYFLRSVACCVIRSEPGRLDEVLEVIQEGMQDALENPARMPACYEGKTDAEIESE